MGLQESKISELRDGRTVDFSVERLRRLLDRFGDVPDNLSAL
jgi:hypothetical protein